MRIRSLVIFFCFFTPGAFAQTLMVHGQNRLFDMTAEVVDNTGSGDFDCQSTTIKKLVFRYTPPPYAINPRALYYRSIFGKVSFTLTENDFEIAQNGEWLASGTKGASGNYLRISLKDHAKHFMRGYDSLGLQTSAYGKAIDMHNIVIFQTDLVGWQYLLHLTTIGRQFFRDPILSCARLLSN